MRGGADADGRINNWGIEAYIEWAKGGFSSVCLPMEIPVNASHDNMFNALGPMNYMNFHLLLHSNVIQLINHLPLLHELPELSLKENGNDFQQIDARSRPKMHPSNFMPFAHNAFAAEIVKKKGVNIPIGIVGGVHNCLVHIMDSLSNVYQMLFPLPFAILN